MVSEERTNRSGSKLGLAVTSRVSSVRKPVSTPEVVDQMALSSRSSVDTMPSRRLRPRVVDRPGPAARICCAGRAWRRSTQVRRVRMSEPSRAAACSSGASSAWARSCQWDPSDRSALEPDAADPTSTRHRAIESAPVHVPHDCRGDQWRGTTPGRGSTDPVGSKRRHRPSPERAAEVASSTSGLVDVDTTGPLLANTLGMISDVVLPERGGPRIMTECCGRAKHQPLSLCPRYAPWCAPADAANTARWRELARWRGFGEKYFVNEFPSRHHLVRWFEPRR